MKTKIAINGFGRIGRMVFRQLFNDQNYEIVAINDISAGDMICYLLKYDTAQGKYSYPVTLSDDKRELYVNQKKILLYSEVNAEKLSWDGLGIDTVIDCSGAYNTRDKALTHIRAGAGNVLLSAPAGSDVPMVVYGVNEHILKQDDCIVSAASCSTNALAPMAMALHNYVLILSGIMTVVHGFTATQMLVDAPQKKGNLRRSRSAATNIIPTTAEAAKAVGIVIPELEGKLSGSAVRVPVTAGCFLNFIANVKGNNVTVQSVNNVMKSAASEIMGYTEEEFVSSDIVGIHYASLFDATQTIVNQTDNNIYQVRIATWFDNETSFSAQMVRTLKYMNSSTTCCRY